MDPADDNQNELETELNDGSDDDEDDWDLDDLYDDFDADPFQVETDKIRKEDE